MKLAVTGTGRVSALLHRELGATMISHDDCRRGQYPPCDILVHAGARVFADVSIRDPFPYIHQNIVECYQFLEDVRKMETRPLVVYLSSKEAERCDSPYAASKASAEALCRAWRHCYQLPLLIIRTPNAFIVDDRDQGFVGKVRRGEIDGPRDPDRRREWLFEKEFCVRLYQAIQWGEDATLRGELYSDLDIAQEALRCRTM